MSFIKEIIYILAKWTNLKATGDCQLVKAMELCLNRTWSIIYVRSIQAASEPMCMLATDQQLVRICAGPSEFVPFAVDPTF